ncbi:hypothetical protein R1sor_006319 [Riccia sorocarpa]|uniref:Uncharacterized protein n=1 Tax=Riccia sorocarpa TaxID=122646 RepID=A0ABD3HMP6_9MARC
MTEPEAQHQHYHAAEHLPSRRLSERTTGLKKPNELPLTHSLKTVDSGGLECTSPSAKDPRVKWDLAWRRVKTVLQEARRNHVSKQASKEELTRLVQAWRSKVAAEDSQATSKEEILFMIWKYYSELYQEEGDSVHSSHLRERILQYLDKKVDDESNQRLVQEHSSEEIDTRVKELAKEKSPGLDCITAEILWENWGLVQHDMKKVI